MRRLIRTGLLTAMILAVVWLYLPSLFAPELPTVETISPVQETVYESVSCSGTVRSANTYRLSLGAPSEILEVYVTEGEQVTAGQAILRYRLLDDDEIVSSLYTTEIAERVDEMADFLQGEAILAAAEYYSLHGELPPYFEDFYLTGISDVPAKLSTKGVLTAPTDGTVTTLQCGRGDFASGLFAVAVIEDTADLVATLRAPERVLSKLAPGLPVNISGDAFGNNVFAGTVLSIGNRAITTGGLLSKSETYIEVTSSIDTRQVVMNGLTVRGTIFFTMYEDAVIVPHEAVTVDTEGKEFVYRYCDGYLVQTPIRILHETESGVVCDGSVSADDILVKRPSETLMHGMAVTVLNETEGKP